MSRISLIERLYVKRKSALEFDYDALSCPPIFSILTPDDTNRLYKIATSLKYSGNMDKKYELIDEIMTRRGFRRAHCGTNRVVYNFLELPTFVAKVALDRVGLTDSPAEFENQRFFKPFCCKIFECDPTGVVAFVERVNPISSKEEFLSVADDIFNLLITKIIGKYVVDDLGSDTYMNFGVRQLSGGCTFGPVIIDYPYAYELDGAKLICAKKIKTPMGEIMCGGEIDYDAGFNHLICNRCGRTYTAMDLKKNTKEIIMFGNNLKGDINMRSRVVTDDGRVILDSGKSSDTFVSKEEIERSRSCGIEAGKVYPVAKTIRVRHIPAEQKRRDYYSELQRRYYEESEPEYNESQIVKVESTSEATSEAAPIVNHYNPQHLESHAVIMAASKEIEDQILPEMNQPADSGTSSEETPDDTENVGTDESSTEEDTSGAEENQQDSEDETPPTEEEEAKEEPDLIMQYLLNGQEPTEDPSYNRRQKNKKPNKKGKGKRRRRFDDDDDMTEY